MHESKLVFGVEGKFTAVFFNELVVKLIGFLSRLDYADVSTYISFCHQNSAFRIGYKMPELSATGVERGKLQVVHEGVEACHVLGYRKKVRGKPASHFSCYVSVDYLAAFLAAVFFAVAFLAGAFFSVASGAATFSRRACSSL